MKRNMEREKHREYKRIVSGARVAVLCVHGILGTPNHFREFIPMIPSEYSVYNIVLDGHCAEVGDFSRASMKDWELTVRRAVDMLLASHEEIYVLAHSMGTLLAIEAAMHEPRITRLFCLSIPIKVGLRPRMISTALKMYFGCVREDDIYAYAATECTGITLTRNIFAYLGWIPRYIELFKKIAQIRRALPSFTTPCVAYQSALDELVSPRSYEMLKNRSSARIFMLEGSTHFYYEKKDLERLKSAFLNFLK